MLALRLRWALRDAKARWPQVAAIALMIAIGTGMYAGLSSTTEWRLASNDASFAITNMYDIRLRLGGAGFLPQGALEDVAKSIEGVEQVEERLISQTQVDVDLGDRSVFARGRIVGVDLSDASVDASVHKAPSGGEGTGKSPVDRGKSGWKWSLLCDRAGIPVGWAADGANRHDQALLEPTLADAERRGLLGEVDTLHLDRGYSGNPVLKTCHSYGIGDVVRAPKRCLPPLAGQVDNAGVVPWV